MTQQERMRVTKGRYYQFLDQLITRYGIDGQFKKTSEVGGNQLTIARQEDDSILLICQLPAKKGSDVWQVGKDGPRELISGSDSTPNLTDKFRLVESGRVVRDNLQDPAEQIQFDDAFDEALGRVIQTFGINADQLQTAP